MSDIRYLIDTSVFIQAYRAYYSFSLCPGFWDSLVSLHNQGRVFSIDRVFEEICYGEEDELVIWAKKILPKNCFCSTDESSVIKWYADIQSWANSEPQFLTVVTKEVYSLAVKNRIPIPNVCKAPGFKVNCVNVFTMLSRLGVQFVAK